MLDIWELFSNEEGYDLGLACIPAFVISHLVSQILSPHLQLHDKSYKQSLEFSFRFPWFYFLNNKDSECTE